MQFALRSDQTRSLSKGPPRRGIGLLTPFDGSICSVRVGNIQVSRCRVSSAMPLALGLGQPLSSRQVPLAPRSPILARRVSPQDCLARWVHQRTHHNLNSSREVYSPILEPIRSNRHRAVAACLGELHNHNKAVVSSVQLLSLNSRLEVFSVA